MPANHRNLTFTALVAILSLVLVACTTGGGASASVSAPASVAASAEPSVAASAEPSVAASAEATESATATTSAGAVTVMTSDSSLGTILVDAEGKTLYAFLSDTAGESTCYDDCAAAWPALLAEGEITVGEGLDDSMFSTVARTDGGSQVKVGEWPLYYFANDAAPGDVNGQGRGEVWFVVGTDGEPIRQ